MAAQNRQPMGIRRESKSHRIAAEVGGVQSTVRGPGTTQPGPGEGPRLCSRTRRAEDQGIAMTQSTPDAIRTLQRKRYTKAKQEPI